VLTSGEPGSGGALSGYPGSDMRERGEADGHGVALGRLAGWMNRSFSAIADEIRPVESGSLDVLLYCADDLAPSSATEVELESAT
jgi:hypothetical protein